MIVIYLFIRHLSWTVAQLEIQTRGET